jgi:hypothetical protein
VNWDADIFDVITLSNSTIFDSAFNQPEMHINFNVTVPTNMMGFYNVTIPLELLGGPYTCLLDGSPVTTIETSNSTHASLYITYNYSGYVQITGTTAIPKLPNILTILLLLSLLILVLLHTKK